MMQFKPSRAWIVVTALAAALAVTGAAAAADRSSRGAASHDHSPAKKKGRSAETPFGREGDPRKVNRVIRIDMSDAMRFFPDQVKVKRGDTVRFIVRNRGELRHELVLGTMDDLKQHAALMKKTGEMKHEGSHLVRVRSGATGRIVWQFTKTGEFYFGCLIPGHFDAGMIGTLVVR
jgi:uncharacterized cupredoxin-like copper-binding protein